MVFNMNNNIRNNAEKVPVNATEIINKYRKLQDRLNFCFEKNWFHPREVGYDASYFLLVLKGEKFYLPNNFTVNYNIGYFRSGEKLDKQYLINKMKSNNKYALYTPDICNPMKFSKSFLLKLIAYVDPNLFREIYSTNKKQKAERDFNKWADFKIDIRQDLLKDIQDFHAISSGNDKYGGFRRTKNHNNTNIFYSKDQQKQNMNYLNRQKEIQQMEQYTEKEVIMNDLTSNNNIIHINKNDGMPELGKDKNGKNIDVYPKGKAIEIKIKK